MTVEYSGSIHGQAIIPTMPDLNSQFIEDEPNDNYTIFTYNKNDQGCDDIADETIKFHLNSDMTIAQMNNISEEELAQMDEYDREFFETPYYQVSDIQYEFNIDENIDYFQQGQKSDCWLLAALESLSFTEAGKKIINDAISKNDDGSYNVTFSGIDKTYTITNEELNDARISESYSNGDATVLLLELAVEKALSEMAENTAEYDKEYYDYTEEESQDDEYAHNKLAILSNLAHNAKTDKEAGNSMLDEGRANFATVLFNIVCHDYYGTADSASKIDEITNLDNAIMTVSFSSSNKQEDYCVSDINNNSINILTNHLYTVKSMDKENNTITIINPHDTSTSFTLDLDTAKEIIGMATIGYLNNTNS